MMVKVVLANCAKIVLKSSVRTAKNSVRKAVRPIVMIVGITVVQTAVKIVKIIVMRSVRMHVRNVLIVAAHVLISKSRKTIEFFNYGPRW